MTRLACTLVLLSVALGGCDNGPSFEVTEEPAGANCATGGFRIEADGVVFYSCDGQATTENVPEGAEGNPCFGPALRVTIPLEDGTTGYAYVCQTVEVDPVAAGLLTMQFDAVIAQGRIDCLCEPVPADRAECESQLSLYEAASRSIDGCIGQVLGAAGDLPAVDRPAVECVLGVYTSVIDCIDAIEATECSMAVEDAVAACEAMSSGTSACAAPTAAFTAWASRAQTLGQFLGCPVAGGGT